MKLLIKNSQVTDSSSSFYGDVYIRDGIITQVGQHLDHQCPVIDGSGLVLLPAFIDMHAHFRDPGYTEKEDIDSGSHAAVRGGYTWVNLMANTKPIINNNDQVEYIINKAQKTGLADVHQSCSITKNFSGHDISHLNNLSQKVRFVSDDGFDVASSRVMLAAMEICRDKNITVICHCEDPELSAVNSRLAENLMTQRNIALAAAAGCRIHIAHVSTREAMEAVITAKRQGVKVTCEATPHHLTLTSAVRHRVNPPLREDPDVNFLIEAAQNGFIDVISTDHAPHTAEDVAAGAMGISGLETAFPICYTKLVKNGPLPLRQLSRLLSQNPAVIAGLNKGKIEPGRDGDLVLVNLSDSYTINTNDFSSRGHNTPFQGMKVWGKIITTIKQGKVVFRNDNRSAIS